jgi:hypothetical protein
VNNPWITFDNCHLRKKDPTGYMNMMTDQSLPHEIEVYEIGSRRLYAKTRGGSFALFEDELTPEELVAIARDIAARRPVATDDPFRKPVGVL